MSALVLAAILALAPALPHATAERYTADIVAACGDEAELCWALVATQHEESRWRTDVETCAVTGDGGAAVTAWQLHRHWWGGYDSAELCASNRLATSLAASALIVLEHRTGGMTGALRAYMGAKPGHPGSVRRIRLFRKLRGAP